MGDSENTFKGTLPLFKQAQQSSEESFKQTHLDKKPHFKRLKEKYLKKDKKTGGK